MTITDLLKNLKLDEYYMLFVYLGSVLLCFSLFVPTQWLSNKQLGLFSLGILCIGLGEWKNHKFVSWIKPANAYTGGTALITNKIRQPDLIGNIIIFIGMLFVLGGLFSVFSK